MTGVRCCPDVSGSAYGFLPLQQQRHKRDEVALNQALFCLDNGERLSLPCILGIVFTGRGKEEAL